MMKKKAIYCHGYSTWVQISHVFPEDPEDIRRPSSTKSSAVFCLGCVHVRDVPEDPENFYNSEHKR